MSTMQRRSEAARHRLIPGGPSIGAAPTNDAALFALLPPTADVSLEEVDCVARCIEESVYLASVPGAPQGEDAAVILDPELGFDAHAVDLPSKATVLRMPCLTSLPILTIHMRDCGRFTQVEVTVLDEANQMRHLVISNRQSVVRVRPTDASMPLKLVPGWNLVRLDLRALVRAAFGVGYGSTTEVVVHGVTRVFKAFLSDKQYEDAELPQFLRVLRLPLDPALLARQG